MGLRVGLVACFGARLGAHAATRRREGERAG
jgi:hypothetical protein